ncbi:MAG: class I SAM-dependent methyltransferase, partial [Nocardioidaceae bacterium]
MRVATTAQLLDLLDRVFDDGSDWTHRQERDHWEGIFNRADHPLNSDLPDACLVDWHARGLIPAGDDRAALDIGCGLGRNTRWLARQHYRATGIDISPYAVAEARRRSTAAPVTFVDCDVLREEVPGGPFDLVYDSGCFHHLPPHRRLSYLRAIAACLAPQG